MTEQEWLTSIDPVLNYEDSPGWPSARKQRLFAVACARRVVPLLPDHPCWPECLAVAGRYAERRARRPELNAAVAAAAATARGGPQLPATFADTAVQLAGEAVRWACSLPRRRYAAMTASRAACAVAYAALPPGEQYVPPAYSAHRAAWAAAETAERTFQFHLLRDLVGPPSPPIAPDPARRTPTARRLARAAHDESDVAGDLLTPARLAVLADALEEAGCTDADLLGHLRGPGPHGRGCWAMDLLLGRE